MPFHLLHEVSAMLNRKGIRRQLRIIKLAITEQAAIGFAELLEKDQYVVGSQFFLGLSQLGLDNNQQAINLLSGVANGPGEYGKEARWYLGMAYLKTADKQKAAECFSSLSGADGYYKTRSEKILRRLK